MIEKKVQKKKIEDNKAKTAPRIRIKIKSYDHRVIDEALKGIIEAIVRTGAKVVGPVFLPTEKKKYTVIRASFVHKDSRDQFEKRVHKRFLDIFDFNPETMETLTNLNLPAGVDVEIKM